MEINVRLATVDDVEKIIRARFDYFKVEKWEITSEQHSVIESNLKQYFTRHINLDFFAAIIEEDSQIVSLYRKRGYATNAIYALIEVAKQHNLSYIELSASEFGKPLYQKLGFQEAKTSRFIEMKLPLL